MEKGRLTAGVSLPLGDRFRRGTLFCRDVVVVVFHCAGDDVFCHIRSVDADELHTACVLSWDVLVGAEVVDEATDDVNRNLLDVCHFAIHSVALEDCNDLVVCLVVVEETKASDRTCVYDDVSVGDVLLSEDAYIKRVTVAFYVKSYEGFVGEFRHLRAAIGAWKESVERRYDVGEFLWTVKRKVA